MKTKLILAAAAALFAGGASTEAAAQTTIEWIVLSAKAGAKKPVRTSTKLDAAGIARLAKGLSKASAQFARLKDRKTSATLDRMARSLGGRLGGTSGLSGQNMVQEMMQMNMQFLQLQQQLQNESRKFQILSNVLAARRTAARRPSPRRR